MKTYALKSVFAGLMSCLVLTTPFQAFSAQEAKKEMPPDILLIVIDSLRPDYMGCYGQTLPTTPSMDEFAKSCVKFNNNIASSSWTLPSMMTLYTSLPPEKHGRHLPDVTVASGNLPEVLTLADVLKKNGYQTVAVIANNMAGRRFGFATGFDLYDDFSVAVAANAPINEAAGQAPSGMVLTQTALNHIKRRDPGRPLFLLLFYLDPHWDYFPPPPYNAMFTDDTTPPLNNIYYLADKPVSDDDRRRILAAYAGEVRYTDDCIKRLLEGLAESPRGNETAVVVTADHGEAFWEHGWIGHGFTLYEEEIRVPLLVRPPASFKGAKPGSEVAGLSGLIDVAPTLLDIAGIPIPSEFQGISLAPALRGEPLPADRSIALDVRINELHGRATRTATTMTIFPPKFDVTTETYDLATDPGQRKNLSKEKGN